MNMSTSVIFAGHIPVENRYGGGDFLQGAPAPYPLNCEHPCCYGKGRCFCWPGMKEILESRKSGQKG